MDKLKELKIEREKLRNEVRGKTISSWKFWQLKRDEKIVRKQSRICQINDILQGARLQEDISYKHSKTKEKSYLKKGEDGKYRRVSP